MKKSFIALLAVIIGASIAVPVLALNGNQQEKAMNVISSYLQYNAANTPNGAVIYLTSTNAKAVHILHDKYDALPRTSNLLYNSQAQVSLMKINNGIQLNISVLNITAPNGNKLVKIVQSWTNSPKPSYYRMEKTYQLIKNNFGPLL